MKIFFTTSFEGKKYYQKNIDEIVRIIESTGAKIISPEKRELYLKTFSKANLKKYDGDEYKAHYYFIEHGIASSDAVIIEASNEDFRIGHEATLALLYKKPILVLSQKIDYGKFIPHDNFIGKKYTPESVNKIISDFLTLVGKTSETRAREPSGTMFDLTHSSDLALLRLRAQQGSDYVADWARRAENEPEVVYKEIEKRLGGLPVHEPWEVFAEIYDEDTPDYLNEGTIRFADKVFRSLDVRKSELIVDVASGTGAFARLLTNLRYSNIVAFDISRPMLGEAYRLCTHMPNVKIVESSVEELKLYIPAKGMIWAGYSSNYFMTNEALKKALQSLINNLQKNGCLIFDIRTVTGWGIDFYNQKVTVYETDRFQRLWLNIPNYETKQIKFDIFIRVKDKSGNWKEWKREQMVEKMWDLSSVKNVVNSLKGVKLEGIYGDGFNKLSESSAEPLLAYFVIIKK